MNEPYVDQSHFNKCKDYFEKVRAASLGCALCKGKVRYPPSGEPFSSGPHRGRYFCADCWTIYWAEHPEHLADEASRDYCKKEAERLKRERSEKPKLT